MNTNRTGCWQVPEQEYKTIANEAPLQVELLSSSVGQLRLGLVSGSFPEGQWLLALSNWAKTLHWYAPARLEGNDIVVSLQGTEQVYDPNELRPFRMELARVAESGLIRYPLRGRRFKNRFFGVERNPYFYDNRDLWTNPADSFLWGDTMMELMPRFLNIDPNTIEPVLLIQPRSLRWWDQIRCGLLSMDSKEGKIVLKASVPEGVPDLKSFVIHPLDGSEKGQKSYPAFERDGCWYGFIPRQELPSQPGQYGLSVCFHQEDDLCWPVPLAVQEPKLHRALADVGNGYPLWRHERTNVYLQIKEDCCFYLEVSQQHPAAQQLEQPMELEEALESGLLPELGLCSVRDLGGQDWCWRFETAGLPLEADAQIGLYAEWKNRHLLLPVEMISCTQGRCLLSADLKPLLELLPTSQILRWKLRLAIRQKDTYYNMELLVPERTIRRGINIKRTYLDYSFSFGPSIGVQPYGSRQVEGLICCPSNGICCFQTSEALRRDERKFVCRASKLQLDGHHLVIHCRCPHLVKGDWKGFALLYRYKLELDHQNFFFPADKIKVSQDYTELSVRVDLQQFRFTPLYWDLRAVYEDEDGISRTVRIRYEVREKKNAKSIISKAKSYLKGLFNPDSYDQDLESTVSLYRTADFNVALVCQERSPYSGLAFRLKEHLALVIAQLFKKQLRKKSIYLCYEKYCCMAQDNGFYFFKHCMDHDMEKKMHRSIYFVIDKKQSDYQERLLPYQDHVIDFMSLKHMVYILACRLLISSDSKAHAYAWRAKESVILPRVLKRKKLVFLQHGVIALKRVEFYSKGTNAVNLFVTSNQREHDIIVSEMAYPDEDVIITGLARWDVLKDKGLEERRVLVMPTWRNWLEEVSDVAFISSDYYRNYMSLLNDPRLARLLEEQDLYLDFYIHPKFREYLSNFTIDNESRVRLIPFGSEPLNQLIMGCKLLITDYSSVCWDVYYQGKPVLFYQFDVEEYNASTGSYIDLETELFGDRALTPEELLELLRRYAEDDFRLPEPYASMRPRMYAYLDQNNSQRTCEEIMKRHL